MKVKVIGQRARSQCKKNLFSMTLHSGFDIWLCSVWHWQVGSLKRQVAFLEGISGNVMLSWVE